MVGGGGEKRPREENGATEGARPAKAGAHLPLVKGLLELSESV